MITKLELQLDGNGNKALRIVTDNGTVRVQTNGNLPITHRYGIGLETVAEVIEYVHSCGTNREKEIMKLA
jgi:hypothetical protein